MSRHPLWLVAPAGIDDPSRVSGGNVFDRRVRDELERLGREVRTLDVHPDAAAHALGRIPDGGLVLIDGLVAISAPDAVEEAVGRLSIAALVHMSVGAFPGASRADIAAEARVLRAVPRVVVPSAWLRDDLVHRGAASVDRMVVAEPGADDAPLSRGSGSGGSLLCVGVVAEHKGHDTLVDALAGLSAVAGWSCTVAGSVRAHPEFASTAAERASRAGLSERVTWAGVLDPDALEAVYRRSDLMVAPSRTESYGIAVGDALRRGIPVVASRVGGLPEAVRPSDAGILVPPGDPAALESVLRRWIAEPALRSRMTAAARAAAPLRPRWSDTARVVDEALRELR